MRDNKRDVSQLVDLQETLEELKLQMRQHQKLHDQMIKLVLAIKKDAGTMETHLEEVETAIRQSRLAEDVKMK